jgi:hypothetical protein
MTSEMGASVREDSWTKTHIAIEDWGNILGSSKITEDTESMLQVTTSRLSTASCQSRDGKQDVMPSEASKIHERHDKTEIFLAVDWSIVCDLRWIFEKTWSSWGSWELVKSIQVVSFA